MSTCETCGGELNQQLLAAIEARNKAEQMATQATSELGQCFLKFEQTCAAYNQLKREYAQVVTAACLEPRFLKERIGAMAENVHELAYLKWEAAGCPPGDGQEFWLQAEAEINAKAKVKKTSDEEQPKRRTAAKASPKRK